jgi:hypothetical protein
MTQLERLAQNIIFGANGEDMQKVITTITNGGVVGVETIIRWKDSGEICQRDIAISKHETTEDFWYDEDFLFNVNDVPHFLSLLANLDFINDEFSSESEWLQEIHKYEGEDKDDYFHSGEDFDVIDVIGKYFIEPDQFDEPMIGTKEVVEGGVKYTPDQTNQGYVFKDLNEIKNKTNNVCYIAECEFDNGDLIINEDNLPKLIDLGGVCTYQSALSNVKSLVAFGFPEFAKQTDLFNEFAEKITDYILQEVDWCCFGTWLNDMDLEEELEVFLQEKFTEFAKKRLKEDGDGTTYKTDDELFYKFADYFGGGYFYRNDDYSLTDWDSLIDRWEDEPNY